MAIEIEKNIASGSTVIDENRGRDYVHQNPKKRGTSKEVVKSLDQRVTGVETSTTKLKNQVEGLEGLDSDFMSKREDFRVALNTLSGDLKREIHDLRVLFIGEITKIQEEFGEEVFTLHQVIEDLQADMALCKRSLASGGGNTNHGPKIDVPKPSPFIKMATRYLKDTTTLWWRPRYEDIKLGTATIDTLAEFVADFKKKFYPENAKNEVKNRLRKLKKSKTIREYVKEFTTLVLEIPELSDQDSHFYFLDGVQGWAKMELERQGVQDLSTGIAYAKVLIDFSTRRDSSKPKDHKVNQEKATRMVDASYVMDLIELVIARRKQALTVKMEVPKVVGKGLQYMEATINGVKAVNSLAKAIHGVAKDVWAKIGEWEGMIDLSVVPMDDFKVVLGLEFLNKVRAFPMPLANSLYILDGKKTCIVSTERDAKSGVKTLPSMQFKKGFNKSEPFYLAVTSLETDEGLSKVEVPKAIERVLEEFKDVMPKELPKNLPPRREVDHTIELETGSKPPAKAQRIAQEATTRVGRATQTTLGANRYGLYSTLESHARYFTKLDLRSGYYQVRIAEGDEAKMTCVTRRVLGAQDQGRWIDDGRWKDKGYLRLGTTNQGYRVEIFSWLGELLSKVHHGILGHSIPFDGPIEEEQSLDMGRRVPRGVREFEESGYGRAGIETTGCDHAFRVVHGCIRLCYWRSLMQDGHPIAFESQKLNETKRKYTVQEKEMTAVVHFLRIWRPYLLDFLAEFDYQLEYKPGKANVVVDALSRKKIIALAKDERTRRFWLKGDMLFTKGDRLYVPKWGDLRRAILKECHDSKWAGHPGITRTFTLVEGTYYWPKMGDDVETFVQTCLICQQDKIEQKKSRGLLEPLPTPKGPWESVSMDFITCLPKSEGGGSIIVVVDRFSKYGTFIAAPPDVTADDTTKLFFKNVVKYWGVPHVIVSDRDPRFTRRFWTELVNALLELYLRHYVSANQHDWAKLLDVAQFSYNMQRSEATGKSPFELVTGRQPLTPNALAASYERNKAAKKMKKWADEKRRHFEFEVGDQVTVKLLPQQFKSLRKVHKGLIRMYEGPFLVIGRVGNVSYRVQLPPKLKIHPVFHVSFLKPYHGDEEDPKRGVSKRAPTAVVTSYDREVEEILSDRTIRRRGVPSYKEYLIKWRDLPNSEASWEAEDLLWQFANEIKRYHEDGTTRTSRA
ncbi:putative nucleotidyltransferase, ribonuclease H [Tanacetum coccineum]